MKVIFLDIDGVLNADCDLGGRSKPNPFVISDTGVKYAGICKTHVKYLKKIADETDAKIVLVSSWKDDYVDYIKHGYRNRVGKYLYNKLRKFDLKIAETTLKYDHTFGSNRGFEIRSYLKEHPEVENYVIIDDYMFEDYTDELLQHLYQTDEQYGLDMADIEPIKEILNGK